MAERFFDEFMVSRGFLSKEAKQRPKNRNTQNL